MPCTKKIQTQRKNIEKMWNDPVKEIEAICQRSMRYFGQSSRRAHLYLG